MVKDWYNFGYDEAHEEEQPEERCVCCGKRYKGYDSIELNITEYKGEKMCFGCAEEERLEDAAKAYQAKMKQSLKEIFKGIGAAIS